MPLDASIPLQVQGFKAPDSMNMLAQVMQIQNAQNQNALSGYTLAKAQRQDQQTNALMSALQGGLDISTPDGQTKALSIAPEAAQSFIKNRLEGMNTQAQIGERQAQAGKHNADALTARVAQYRDASQAVTDPASATQLVQSMYADPALKGSAITAMPIETFLQHIPQDPAGFNTWKQQFALGAQKYIELNKPTTNVVNTGGTTQMLQTPGLGGAPTLAGTMQNTQSPDAQLHAQTSLQTTGMQNATSRANNTATIAAENLRAGVTPGGGMDENSERTAQAIANGQLPAPTGMALLNPKNQRILGRVMEINPQYDATTVSAKKKAASDFTTGPQGNAMRSFAVAGQHLDQLGQLVDALGNGNLQIVNKLGNMYSSQTGSPAPTNFDAAKDVVSKEVVKAIVAGGGGVAERQELSHLMDNAKSPAQLKGVIQQYRNLMAAQHDALLQQRDAAGLPRSTLPSYTDANGSASTSGTPSGWQYLGTTK